MKKSFAVLALVLVCAMLVPCFASAVSFTAQADAMKDMGLFLGTNNGYDLDKAPTRAQAAVMLVRFLGKEAEAKAGEWETPFTDVPDWAKPYVGYLYENDLTKGMSETTYVPDDVCSAQMYVTFILRALGYMDADGKDTFEYAKALEFGTEKGLVTEKNCDTENFLRDHMVGIAYTALALPTADGAYEALVTKLAADGVVTAEQAAKVLDGSYIPSEGGDDDEITPITDANWIEMQTYDLTGYYAPYCPSGLSPQVDIKVFYDMEGNILEDSLGYILTTGGLNEEILNKFAESGDGEWIHATDNLAYGFIFLANPDNVFIFNGEPGDSDYGQSVCMKLVDVNGTRLGVANNFSGFVIPYFAAVPGEEVIESGVYTIVFVADDGTAYGFSADLNQNTHYGFAPWTNMEGQYAAPSMGPQQP